jgi:hypothetical protein
MQANCRVTHIKLMTLRLLAFLPPTAQPKEIAERIYVVALYHQILPQREQFVF